MGGVVIPPYQATAQPCSKTAFHLAGSQPMGTYTWFDQSGNGADGRYNSAVPESSLWANSGYATLGGTANYNFQVDLAASNFDLASQSVIVYGVMNMAIPATSTNIVGNGSSLGGGYQGVFLSARSGLGKLRPIIVHSAGTLNTLQDSTRVFCDGTDHAFFVAIDGQTKCVIIYCDGLLSDFCSNLGFGGTPAISQNWFIGTDVYQGVTNAAVKLKSHGLMRFSGGLPSNLSQMARRHAARPAEPFTDAEVGA
jgi:hypothetical protein